MGLVFKSRVSGIIVYIIDLCISRIDIFNIKNSNLVTCNLYEHSLISICIREIIFYLRWNSTCMNKKKFKFIFCGNYVFFKIVLWRNKNVTKINFFNTWGQITMIMIDRYNINDNNVTENANWNLIFFLIIFLKNYYSS